MVGTVLHEVLVSTSGRWIAQLIRKEVSSNSVNMELRLKCNMSIYDRHFPTARILWIITKLHVTLRYVGENQDVGENRYE